MRELIRRLPLVKSVVLEVRTVLGRPFFPGSVKFWESRYRKGNTSGGGSYGRLAQFKAQTLNSFVADNGITSVIEFGCGDGHQLTLARYPRYVGLDVSRTAIHLCKERFKNDRTKSFYLYESSCFVDNLHLFTADLAISLDVVYHLVEDEVYTAYMSHIFDAARKFVIVYSSDGTERCPSLYIRHRPFTSWVASHRPEWSLVEKIDNPYPYDGIDSDTTSWSDFFVFNRQSP
ncbi:MAG: class I SAM-dependent methyltransferase [Phycisphaerae bacterium]